MLDIAEFLELDIHGIAKSLMMCKDDCWLLPAVLALFVSQEGTIALAFCPTKPA